jgi:hypothetical protein
MKTLLYTTIIQNAIYHGNYNHLNNWTFFSTNILYFVRYSCGVCFQLSRVNHSCSPNTEFVWNEDDGVMNLRCGKPADITQAMKLNSYSL